jgi:SAM-dependent methyltransferase
MNPADPLADPASVPAEPREGFGALRKTWETNARRDALCAILTVPGKEYGRWDRDEFFATGEAVIADALAQLEALGAAPKPGRVLDFGCGVGRLTQALAARFREADGVDVSATMVDLARRYNRHGDRCRYHLNDQRADLSLFADGTFDFVYSLIVLQHIPPPLALGYVREFARVLAPGGVVVFQQPAQQVIPTPKTLRSRLVRLIPYAVRAGIRKLIRRERVHFEMHVIPREQVVATLEDAGLEVVSVDRENSAGDPFLSYRYTARKPAA